MRRARGCRALGWRQAHLELQSVGQLVGVVQPEGHQVLVVLHAERVAPEVVHRQRLPAGLGREVDELRGNNRAQGQLRKESALG